MSRSRVKAHRSRRSRTAAAQALSVARGKRGAFPKRARLPIGATWLHGGPDNLRHPRWSS